MESPEIERRCHVLIGLGLTLLTAGIGLDVLVGGGFAAFVIIVTGLFIGWIAWFYCIGHASFWE